MANASGLSISMPSIPGLAYNNGSTNYMLSVPGDIAMASTQSYAGIGNTTGGGPRALGGRRGAAPTNNDYDSWLRWLHGYLNGIDPDESLDGNNIYNFDYNDAWNAFCDWFSMAYPGHTPDDYTGADATILWEQWLSWFKSNNGSHQGGKGWYNFVPVGDYLPLLFMALFYVAYIFIRRREVKKIMN
jgi:hypothetical protein